MMIFGTIFVVFMMIFGTILINVLRGFAAAASPLDLISKVFRGQTIMPRGGPAYTLVRNEGTLFKVSIRNENRQFLSISAVWSPPDEPKQLTKDGESFRMSLTLERIERRYWRLRNQSRVPDLELGNPEFDRCFYIRSNDSDKVTGILNSRAQDLAHQIYLMSELQRFELRVTGDQLQLDTGLLADAPNARVFKVVRLFMELHRTMVDSTQMIGKIEIEEVLLQDTICLICGDVVDDPSVTCSDCQTEYHLDCWNYVEQCGRYACGGTRFVRNNKGEDKGEDSADLYRIDE